MNMGNTLKFVPIAALIGFASAGSVFAADFPKEGRYDYTACWSGVATAIAFSKTNSAFNYEMTGTTLSNPPGGFLDKRSFHCVGMATSFGGKRTNTAVCESLGTDDGKILTHFSAASDGTITRGVVEGTGRYEGLVSSGIAQPLGPFPAAKPGTFQECNHQTGTYTMK